METRTEQDGAQGAADSVKLPLSFDQELLKRDVDGLRQNRWEPHFNAAYFEGDWSGVALRAVGGAADKLYPDPAASEDYSDTPLLGRCAYIPEVLAAFSCRLESVRLLRLGPGSKIREHSDYKLSLEDGVARLHIPVFTNAGVEFYIRGRRVEMREGECWYINFNLPHRVGNNGETDRVHLVLDCVVNDWLRSMIRSVGPPQALAPAGGFEEFHRLVLSDVGLQRLLRDVDDANAFPDAVGRLGAERGFCFTADDVQAALREARREWFQRWV